MIRDKNLPKIIFDDIETFEDILLDLFPGCEIHIEENLMNDIIR